MSLITIKIMDTGRVFQVPWTNNMNGQQALERAYDIDQLEGSDFSFGLQYFGHKLGYMVFMLDGIYDDVENKKNFWVLIVNDKVSDQGIDSVILNPDDEMKFDYQSYATDTQAHFLMIEKYRTYMLMRPA
ncbi:DUF4430 domain-containing protein [Solitalea koreensis]|uniref:Transcobalamin-like C-terminal domain-containing protein n=1 Tax=Solitalea koreensis TaxID=543615 RepID=A0A521AM53_9SPHI|nr:DUF4430 domain-containing protein [Solitalea koreensis]SMO35914.1 protein of unknown function [Solitalea koreensis]